jgi:hypothetical protein
MFIVYRMAMRAGFITNWYCHPVSPLALAAAGYQFQQRQSSRFCSSRNDSHIQSRPVFYKVRLARNHISCTNYHRPGKVQRGASYCRQLQRRGRLAAFYNHFSGSLNPGHNDIHTFILAF